MNPKLICRMAAIEIAMAGALFACAAVTPQPLPERMRPAAVVQAGETPAANPEPKKESTRPPVTPVPAESRTPEEATQRAADPKAPTGALIIKPPINVMPPDTPPSASKQ